MKVGDLICYNAAGMRAKTIGIYMGALKVSAPYYKLSSHIYVYKIFWLVVSSSNSLYLVCLSLYAYITGKVLSSFHIILAP